MKNLIGYLVIALLIATPKNVDSQVDLGVDFNGTGLYVTGKAIFASEDNYVFGGAQFGYDLFPYNNVHCKGGIIGGIWTSHWLQVYTSIELMSWTDRRVTAIQDGINVSNPKYDKNRLTPIIGLGAYIFLSRDLYVSLAVSYPGFANVGLGYRFRIWNKLDAFDRQQRY